uniref:Uncharacterized protein n=1 Tax=Dactylella sp. TaxID=1814903 RepID=A0A482DQV8_9PEZI|nr:hypothetical protein [Dactylella sp.]
MFTLGGLKFHLVLPLIITIWWKLLTITLLGIYLILVKMFNFEQSSGNFIKKSYKFVKTSETRRNTLNIKGKYSPLNKNSLFNLNNYFNLYPKLTLRVYSTSNVKKEDNTKNLNPLITYYNFKEDKVNILKEQKDKSGV